LRKFVGAELLLLKALVVGGAPGWNDMHTTYNSFITTQWVTISRTLCWN